MNLIIGILLVAIFLFALASCIHHFKQRHYLKKHLKVDFSLKEKAGHSIGIDGASVAGVSTLDVIFHTYRMNPHVLEGINHLHHRQNFENLDQVMNFVKDSIIKGQQGSGEWKNMIDKYKGYTGEQIAYENLNNRGINVDKPDSGTNQGDDGYFDGKPFNVKTTDYPSEVNKHLNKYPEIDAYTNVENSKAFIDNPRSLSGFLTSNRYILATCNERFFCLYANQLSLS